MVHSIYDVLKFLIFLLELFLKALLLHDKAALELSMLFLIVLNEVFLFEIKLLLKL